MDAYLTFRCREEDHTLFPGRQFQRPAGLEIYAAAGLWSVLLGSQTPCPVMHIDLFWFLSMQERKCLLYLQYAVRNEDH